VPRQAELDDPLSLPLPDRRDGAYRSPESRRRVPNRVVRARLRRKRIRRRRIVALILVCLIVFLSITGISLAGALTNPSLGTSISARFAEWTRDHGGGSIVRWGENLWYSHHQPALGGVPPKGAIKVPRTQAIIGASAPNHLTPPAPIRPLASPSIAGEGQWSPAGRLVGHIPAVYETTLRPDPIHTSLLVGVAWMDTSLLQATLYSGSYIPGGGPFDHTAPIQTGPAGSLVAAFNAGFRVQDSNGGYFTDGRVQAPLRPGAASFVIYRNGTATVSQWGRDASLTPNVVAVRQNLDLLVDGGSPVAGLNAHDTARWGATLGNRTYVWRSGLGVTASGALVYVGGPGLNITTLADLLVRAGAVRGMELDINTDWVAYATYAPSTTGGAAAPSNGSDLLANMVGSPGRYFQASWTRDFITMSAATGS
jgi:Phosphodiester glycosidase